MFRAWVQVANVTPVRGTLAQLRAGTWLCRECGIDGRYLRKEREKPCLEHKRWIKAVGF